MTELTSGIHQDIVASHLRSQIHELKCILEKLENDKIGRTYMDACLKQVETNVRKLRAVSKNN